VLVPDQNPPIPFPSELFASLTLPFSAIFQLARDFFSFNPFPKDIFAYVFFLKTLMLNRGPVVIDLPCIATSYSSSQVCLFFPDTFFDFR